MPLSFKTWLYFAIMAAITLLLLWLFQFFLFDLLYYERQEAHLKSVSSDLIMQDYSMPDSWSKIPPLAKNQNLNIYVFSFNINDVRQENGSYTFPTKYSLSFFTPYYSNNNATVDSINWSNERIQTYLESLKNMNEEKSFTYMEESDENSLTNTLIYGGELKGNQGSNTKFYFCMIASISTNNYATTMQQNLLLIATAVIFVISVIMSLIFSRRLSNPINRLALTANHLATGDFKVTFESDSCIEVQQLASSLNFAKEELSKTDEMRREFMANVSHDLRTPLTMIQAYAEMIRDLSGGHVEKRTKHCQIIIDETKRLSMLVGDIQNLSKLQSGTDSFNMTKFDISQLCKTVVQRFGIMSETHGYIFELDCDENAICMGDYQKIEQVLYNLIGNAVNYTGDDKKITVRCKKVDNSCKVEIVDTGKGIAPEDIDNIWDRYYRINQKKRNIVGSGLGLNIVKMILVGHNAKHGIKSELSVGSNFWFMLNCE